MRQIICIFNETWFIFFLKYRALRSKSVKKKQLFFLQDEGGFQNNPTKLNVLIIVNDGVSRLNMERHMPTTLNYLKSTLNAIDLQGYTKIGLNSYPNMAATLMGYTVDELWENLNCPNNISREFDNCPFIWKNFSNNGYATLFGEDAVDFGSYIYRGRHGGFINKPTDYYINNFMKTSEQYLSQNYGGICQENNLSIDILYKFIFEAAETLKDIPFFGFIHSVSLTHNELSKATVSDERSLKLLQKLSSSNILNNTILFFMSDHGLRFGPIRRTIIGYVEDRTPYVTLVFPKWFSKQFPDAWHNLNINQNRLTSNLDLHQTLKDILNKNFKTTNNNDDIKKSGISLFQKIPTNRTCSDLKISGEYCVCQNDDMIELSVEDSEIEKCSLRIVDEINKRLKKFKECSTLRLNKVRKLFHINN